MNIVHRDILNKGIPLRQPFHQAGSIADFAKLAFILCPVQSGAVLPLNPDQEGDREAIRYMRVFTAHLNLPLNDENLALGLALECNAFHEHLKYLNIEKRIEMWEGNDFFEPMPQRLKELIPFNVDSVSVIFNRVIDNPNFCRLNRAIFDGGTDPWEQISSNVWDGEHMAIITMESAYGGIGHSLVAYAAIRYNDGRNIVVIHDPASGNILFVPTNSPSAINLTEGDDGTKHILSSYNIFDY
jgi:hypothetical protein